MPADRPDPADDPEDPVHRQPPDVPRSPDVPARRRPAAARFGQPRRCPPSQPSPDRAGICHPPGDARDGTTRRGPDDDPTAIPWAEALPVRCGPPGKTTKTGIQNDSGLLPVTADTDDSWSSGETRRLSPEQNAEASKACADIHDEGERVIFPAMLQIEAAEPNRRLAGLEHMLKKAKTGSKRRSPPRDARTWRTGHKASCFGAPRSLSGSTPPKKLLRSVRQVRSNSPNSWLR